MAKICNTRSKVYETRGISTEEPCEHVESEGDRVIKQMVQKQLNTQANLQQELKRDQHFTSVTEIIPLTEYISGEATLKKFEETAGKAARIEELKCLGLSPEEIKLLINYESERFVETSKRCMSSLLSAELNGILNKIEQARQNKRIDEERINVRSHEKEIGLSVKPDSEHTKLLNFVLSCKKSKPDDRPPDHPINNLKTIEKDLFDHTSKKQKRALPKLNKRPIISNSLPYLLPFKNGNSLWDIKAGPTTSNKMCDKINNHVYTCKPECLYTIEKGEIVPVSNSEIKCKNYPENTQKNCEAFVVSDVNKSNVSLVSLETISKNRVSVDDIRSMPRFSNYSEGTPSQVLYLKNLNRGFTRDDLISLFGNFESNEGYRIMYRLMTGRMKGQAFVTFPTIDGAKKALQLLNGFIFKGKPIIMQYSREKSSH